MRLKTLTIQLEEMPEWHDHGKKLIERARIQLFAKSFVLQVYDVLARHRPQLYAYSLSSR
jgi:hypothetical protein